MSGRLLALLTSIGVVVLLVINFAYLRPATAGSSLAWLFEQASPTLVKVCTAICVAFIGCFALFLAYQHALDATYPNRHREAAMRDLARLDAMNRRSSSTARPRPAATQPTQPLPVPPDEGPTVRVVND